MAAEELAEFLETGNIVNSVNFPNCSLAEGGVGRLTVIHKNVPNMITQFTKILSDEHINISDMINKSKGDVAYSIYNTDHEIPENVIEKIEAIDGVLRARIIK